MNLCSSSKEFSTKSDADSPVTSERPITPVDKKHFDTLKHYIYKTKEGSCVTIIDEETAITYAHGSHSFWKVGSNIEIFPALKKIPPITVSVKEIHADEDFILLKSTTKLCENALKLEIPHQNCKYIQIGLSGKDGAPLAYHGVIATDNFQQNNGFFLGTAGSAPGDSGGGVFSVNNLTLYGICTASKERPLRNNSTVEAQMKQVNLNASYPHLSYICPSFRINVKPPPSKRKREYEEGDSIVDD